MDLQNNWWKIPWESLKAVSERDSSCYMNSKLSMVNKNMYKCFYFSFLIHINHKRVEIDTFNITAGIYFLNTASFLNLDSHE